MKPLPLVLTTVLLLPILLASTPVALAINTLNVVSAYHFDEGSGTAINDSVGGRNLTTNSAWTTPKIGIYSAAFTTAGSQKATGTVNYGITNAPYSYSLWYYQNQTPGGSEAILWKNSTAHTSSVFAFTRTPGGVGCEWYDGTSNPYESFSPALGVWYHIVCSKNATATYMYVNGALNSTNSTGGYETEGSAAVNLGAISGTANFNGQIDELIFFNKSLTPAEVSDLYNGGQGLAYPFTGTTVFSNVQCQDCTPVNATTPPYTTSDTTPTFNFNTDINANCRVANQDWNYTTMGNSRNCTTGEGATYHICTLTSQDALPADSGTMYIACKGSGYNETQKSSTGPLVIVGIAATDGDAIDVGVHHSAVWPQATVYANQQVYLRDVNNNQLLTTVDRVVVYGNQRWLINYDNTTKLGLFNITPVVYSLDLTNLTLLQIESTVGAFINSTKQ